MIRYLEQLRQWQDRLKEEVDRRNANRPEHAISMVANKRIISGLRQGIAEVITVVSLRSDSQQLNATAMCLCDESRRWDR